MTDRKHWISKCIWVVLFGICFVLFITSLGPHYRDLIAFRGPFIGDPAALRGGLSQLHISVTSYMVYVVLAKGLAGLSFLVGGLVVFWRNPNNPTIRLFSAILVLFGSVWPNTLDSLVNTHPSWEIPVEVLSFAALMGFLVIAFIFPDGKFVPKWTAWPTAILVLLSIPGQFFPAIFPTWLKDSPTLLLVPLALYAQIHRYRRVATPVQRQQVRWIVYSLSVGFLAFLSVALVSIFVPFVSQPGWGAVVFDLISGLLFTLVFSLIAVSFVVAILRFRLWGIDPLVNRTLVYIGLSSAIVVIYVLVVSYLGSVFRSSGNLAISLVATALVAILFQPFRDLLQTWVNRLMYGQRDDPYFVLSSLGRRLESAVAPETVLTTIVETVHNALRLPYVALHVLQEGKLVYGTAASEDNTQESDSFVKIPLTYQDQNVGQLTVAPRSPEETFSPAELGLLADLARSSGTIIHTLQLTAALQQSRTKLVTAREEERRRLRRDLHDGLGPALSALQYQAASANILMESDPDTARKIILDVRDGIRQLTADVRQLVYGLRPPALDQLGLVGALRSRIENLSSSSVGNNLSISVNGPSSTAMLPAAVEVAAYRIAEEALTNVARHSKATECRVDIRLTNDLELEVNDNGIGLPQKLTAGIGLRSMRERVEELGGKLLIETKDKAGVRILAYLPIQKE